MTVTFVLEAAKIGAEKGADAFSQPIWGRRTRQVWDTEEERWVPLEREKNLAVTPAGVAGLGLLAAGVGVAAWLMGMRLEVIAAADRGKFYDKAAADELAALQARGTPTQVEEPTEHSIINFPNRWAALHYVATYGGVILPPLPPPGVPDRGPEPAHTIISTQTRVVWVDNPAYQDWIERGKRGPRPPEKVPEERSTESVIINPAYTAWLAAPKAGTGRGLAADRRPLRSYLPKVAWPVRLTERKQWDVKLF